MINEATVAANINNAFAALAAGDMDGAFSFLSKALDCSNWNAAELAKIDAAYATIKAAAL